MNRQLVITLVILFLILGTGGAFFLGVYLGYENRPAVDKITSVFNKEEGQPADVDFSPFWEAWKILEDRYVNGHSATTTVSNQDRVWGAIAGLAASLGDPYTIFLPPEDKKRFEEDISGNFSGVGMEVGMRDGHMVVVAPLPNTPAKRAGIEAGDRIIKIDGEFTAEMNIAEAVQKIRGEKGTKVVLTMLRNDEELRFEVTRDTIAIPTIETELNPEGIFVIRLFNFSANSPELFRGALDEFIDSGSDKLILDLRGNPGGFLDASVHIASWFLPSSDVVVREVRGKQNNERTHRSLGFNIFTDQLKMVVLVDRGSASASEIVAGALADNGKAVLIGEKTFGKGSVQELVQVTKDTSLKVTISRWFTPGGTSISDGGLEPDILVEVTTEDREAGRDPILYRAIEHLLGQ